MSCYADPNPLSEKEVLEKQAEEVCPVCGTEWLMDIVEGLKYSQCLKCGTKY